MKKILIPMIEVGSGHRMIALAVKEAIGKLYPGEYAVDVIDFAREAGARREDKAMKDIWDFALAHPKLTNNINMLMEAFNGLTRSNLVTKVFFTEFVKKGTRYILDYKPDIVFSTHFFCTSVALFAREKYHFQYKVISFMADPISGHNLWINPKVDTIVAATREARNYLVSMGEPRHKIKVMSFPLNLKFFSKVEKSKEEILTSLGLDTSLKTVLASTGGQGIGDTSKYIKFLYEQGYPFNIIAVCAKNEELARELEDLKKSKQSKAKMAVLGFVDNMHELLEAADFAFTKAGPSTIFEHLVKGIPPIITQSAGIQEKGNIDFCVDNRMGWFVKSQEEFVSLIDELQRTDLLQEYKENIKKNEYVQHLPQAPYELARYVVEELSKLRKKRRDQRNPNLRALILGTRIRINSKNKRYKYKQVTR